MRDFRSPLDAAAELMLLREVEVALSGFDLPGPPLRRVKCECCGEGMNDGLEETRQGRVLCRSCAGNSYYSIASRPVTMGGA